MGKKLRGVFGCLVGVVFFFACAIPAQAEVTLDDLLKRVEALEKENSALKAEVTAMKDRQVAQEARIAAAPAASVALAGNVLKTGPEVTLYGFVKADLVVSSNDMGNTGNSITQTNANRRSAAGGDDPEAHMSAQDTRLGLKFKAPDLDNGGKVTGQFEMDFANSSTSLGGNYTPRVRLAFAQLDFDKWGVNAGQNWDIAAPINSNILNPGALYRAGNLGTRHPQVHLMNKWGEVLGGKLTTKVGAIDGDDPLVEDSGAPAAAAYVGYEREIAGVKSTFGVGGLYGKLNLPGKGRGQDNVYATTVGMTLKFTDGLSFKTEGFVGAGLNKFQGGPTQTTGNATVAATSKALPVKGGFMELTLNPCKKSELNVGYGIDDVNGDMTAVDRFANTVVWSKNQTYYANLKYSLSKDVLLGLEFQEFDTEWLDGAKAHDQRVESALMYKF